MASELPEAETWDTRAATYATNRQGSVEDTG